jgi:dihydropteroate synthase
MWRVVAEHHVPYVLTHASDVTLPSASYDSTMSEVLGFLQTRLDVLHRMGIADVVIDPGFGFGKTQQQNYALLNQMDVLAALHAPILVGISRKSMLYKPLDVTPMDVLPATIAANTIALQRGANILRVHDVAAAKQTIQITELTHNI